MYLIMFYIKNTAALCSVEKGAFFAAEGCVNISKEGTMARSYKVTIISAALCLTTALTLFGCTSREAEATPPASSAIESVDIMPALPPSPSPAAPESASPSPTPSPSPSPAVEYPDLEAQPVVADEFFDDAAFLGNSLIDGFRLFSGLNTCDYYCATSMTVAGAGDLISQMGQQQYGKIYILLGINEIGYDVDYFIDLYQKMLDDIREVEPDADIYIMSLTPVSAYKSSTSDVFTMDRVRMYNEGLHKLAADNECWYVDLVEALAGDDGYLPSDVTTDGVHFTASEYKVWLDYLKTHYAPDEGEL